MGIMDKAKDLKDKAMDAVGADDKIDDVADKVDEKTGNKFSDQVDKGAEAARNAKDKLGH